MKGTTKPRPLPELAAWAAAVRTAERRRLQREIEEGVRERDTRRAGAR